MSRAFNKAVTALFEAGMRQFPDFAFEKPSVHFGLPGERAYCIRHADNVAWICLVLSPKGYNEFTVEFGWSLMGRYPQWTTRPNVAVFDEAALAATPEGFVRLRLQRAPARHDWWSIVAEEDALTFAGAELACAALDADQARELAAPLVLDAMDCVATTGRALAQRILAFRLG